MAPSWLLNASLNLCISPFCNCVPVASQCQRQCQADLTKSARADKVTQSIEQRQHAHIRHRRTRASKQVEACIK